MHKGTCYQVVDFVEVGSDIIISTDIKSLKIPAEELSGFFKELLPAERDVERADNHLETIGAVETGVFKELTGGLMASFRDVQNAKGEDDIKAAVKVATTKIGISKAITDIAKTAIAGKKAMAKSH